MATRTPVPAPDGGAFEAAVDAAARFPGGPYRFGTVHAENAPYDSYVVACNRDEALHFGPLQTALAIRLARALNALSAADRWDATMCLAADS